MEKCIIKYTWIFSLYMLGCNSGTEFSQRTVAAQERGTTANGEAEQSQIEKYGNTTTLPTMKSESMPNDKAENIPVPEDSDLANDWGYNEAPSMEQPTEDQKADEQPVAIMPRGGAPTGKAKSAEPIDIAGAFLAGGFAKRSAGITVIGYDAFSDCEFKTRHVGGADDALRTQLKSRMHIGYYDAGTNAFQELTSANNIDIVDPDILTKFSFGFEVPDDQAHLLSLSYDDPMGRNRYIPVNFPTVFPVSSQNMKLIYGYGPLNGQNPNLYGISSSTSATSTIINVKKLSSRVDPFDHTVFNIASDYFQIKNSLGNVLGVITGSEKNLPDAVNYGLKGDPIVIFGVVGATQTDNNLLHLKVGGLYSKNGYYICPLNQKFLTDRIIAIPASALATAERDQYLSKCHANILSPPPSNTDYWRTNFEWWSR